MQYKLMTISGVDRSDNNSYIYTLILLKYEDTTSFYKIFQYLNNMYQFNPKVAHIDYSSSLRKALLSDNLFNKKSIVIPCFFHFVQSIVKKMRSLKIIKGKINKYAFEINKNIQYFDYDFFVYNYSYSSISIGDY